MNDLMRLDGLTKNYGNNRGVFDISLSVKPGEVFGLVGINGAGKTTMIRHLMGFLRPQRGRTSIIGKDSWQHSAELKKYIGYIPGEIAFPDVKYGTDFFKLQAEYLGIQDLSYAYDLADRFDLDADAKLKRMSKGMKQKTAIVNAFMADPDIFILDEPTTGLDPLMQKVFSALILEQKSRGKTVFMSSHMFNELEDTCDRVAFLKDGRIIDVVAMNNIRGDETVKEYKIEFIGSADYHTFLNSGFTIIDRKDKLNQVTIRIPDQHIKTLLNVLAPLELRFISQNPYTLEAYFKDKYIQSKAA